MSVLDPSGLLARLRRRRLLAVLRGPDPDRLVEAVRVLRDEGVSLAEVSLTSIGALSAIERAADFDGVALGAGTVTDATSARRALDAGARFLVTPAGTADLAPATLRTVGVLVGALTPTEVMMARRAGAAAVKLFPASWVGPAAVSSLSDPFPDTPLVPVGGVGPDMVGPYLRAGATAVGIGSPLVGDFLVGGDAAALVRRARACLDAVRDAGGVQ